MKEQSIHLAHRVGLIRGFGIGLITAAAVFFLILITKPIEGEAELSNEEIISRANALGMIQIRQVEEVYLSDQEVIDKAKELGMIMPEENKTDQIE